MALRGLPTLAAVFLLSDVIAGQPHFPLTVVEDVASDFPSHLVDVDGDGRLDLVRVLDEPFPVKGIIPGRMNADAVLDLILVDVAGKALAVAESGPGGYAVTPPHTLPSGFDAEAAALDVDFDGRDEVAVVSSGPSMLAVLDYAAGGAFTALQSLALPSQPLKVVSFDDDGDAFPDLAVAGAIMGKALVFRGTAGGTFVPSGVQEIAFQGFAVDACTGDVDGDGFGDVIHVSSNLGLLTWAGMTFTAQAVFTAPTWLAASQGIELRIP